MTSIQDPRRFTDTRGHRVAGRVEWNRCRTIQTFATSESAASVPSYRIPPPRRSTSCRFDRTTHGSAPRGGFAYEMRMRNADPRTGKRWIQGTSLVSLYVRSWFRTLRGMTMLQCVCGPLSSHWVWILLSFLLPNQLTASGQSRDLLAPPLFYFFPGLIICFFTQKGRETKHIGFPDFIYALYISSSG
ncbi:hypothetical protein DFH07DRAFT_549473 [Mycena maculata]|uniref:Uncharacterized protein n=1 Tax=Mycena maculata TaxID=230809 RepID=A0AAD7N987_9AGAR|nr:hypothetical protein DFH07DRAFT_549473 [Mycena maculata]